MLLADWSQFETDVESHLSDLLNEVRRGRARGAYHSVPEAYGVIAEEFYKVLMAIHANDREQVRKELLQVAATAFRAYVEFDKKEK